MYEGVAKSSQTELITDYILTIAMFHCSTIQSSPLPVQAMDPVLLPLWEALLADLLQSCAGWSAVVTEYQGHPGTNAFVATRNHKGPSQMSRDGRGPQPCF